jgi:hypothetical protein
MGQDNAKAREFFATACDKGDKDACGHRDELDQEASGGGAPVAGVPGANLTVGSMTVNDMTVNELECRLEGMGFMAAMQLVGAIAAQKKAMDRCAPKGDAPRVSWTFSGGSTKDVEVTGASSSKVEKCVAKAAAKMKSGMNGACAAFFLIGAEAGAKAAYDSARSGK